MLCCRFKRWNNLQTPFFSTFTPQKSPKKKLKLNFFFFDVYKRHAWDKCVNHTYLVWMRYFLRVFFFFLGNDLNDIEGVLSINELISVTTISSAPFFSSSFLFSFSIQSQSSFLLPIHQPFLICKILFLICCTAIQKEERRKILMFSMQIILIWNFYLFIFFYHHFLLDLLNVFTKW